MNPIRIYQPGQWWIQSPALGMGIAWIFCLFRVLKVIVIAGGVAAFLAYMSNKRA
jgi:hypothetical protein